ncbi:MAG TPA: peptidylprolyl isomerase [Verrucomicrobiae bacterium]|nr:peptidylprolyl isomerase [Verrucomicrobiae bacterium]
MKTFKLNLFCAAGLFALIAAGCSNEKPAPVPASPPPPAASTSTPSAAVSAVPALPAGSFNDPSKLTETAPETYTVQFDTTKGQFSVEVTRSLAPNGADRFYNLVRSGFFTDVEFFRVIPGFMCQFGIHGDPAVSAKWREANIGDDPVKGSNTRGAITFATAGPNTRTTQLFINFGDNVGLDGQGFSPFGKVTGTGMDVVDKINGEYGEGAPGGRGPDQGQIQNEGNTYLKKDFPNLDYIKSATVVSAGSAK